MTQLRIVGRVVAADTQQPIKKFAAVPIIHFRADFPSVEHESAVEFANGNFSMEFDRTDVQHGIQFEAPGYATLRVGPYPVGSTVPPVQIRMTPADRFRGRVLNSNGHPVSNARVYVGSYSEHAFT